ncbi:unnamed protein product [Caenorhabditis auriculariae]|uniref:F-box domain-containing protein n=1 Tax=Caenorhabditis auriculariae TaxID=2777116 RepID=A0A8S1GSJ6_9PELO|nr:unnamed protein product [Caenorhabditis auriculariae]
MLDLAIRKLFTKLHVSGEVKKHQQRRTDSKKRRNCFPDNVWSKILDELSPFEQARMRAVNTKLRNLVDERRRRILYLDVLRMDVGQLLAPAVADDGEFFRHPAGRLVLHIESRSALIVVDAHWTTRDAVRTLGAVRHFGAFARTVTLDASVAELCVAGQITNDIAHWFVFQAAAGTSDPVCPSQMPSWIPDKSRIRAVRAVEEDHVAALREWNPRTQVLPFGPLFPYAKELTLRSSIPQLRRLRRFFVYRCPPKYLFDPCALNLLRVTISNGAGRRKQSPTSLKLRPFYRWANTAKLGPRFAVQFS